MHADAVDFDGEEEEPMGRRSRGFACGVAV
jgi:hypothetical protein